MNFKIYTVASQGRSKTQFGGPEDEGRKVKKCGEKWDPKHRCLQKRNHQNLYAYEVEEEDESEREESSEDNTGSQHDFLS